MAIRVPEHHISAQGPRKSKRKRDIGGAPRARRGTRGPRSPCTRVPARAGRKRATVRDPADAGSPGATERLSRLFAHAATHVAMESMGVYWKPIFYVLDDTLTCVLANAAQIAQVPG